mgnify:CR=1 FL=1
MSAKKPKLGTVVKKVTAALGIEQCQNCENREFQMNRWTHKKPIAKLDPTDKLTDENITELYLKYFGLDNTGTTNENVIRVMKSDLEKLFSDAN